MLTIFRLSSISNYRIMIFLSFIALFFTACKKEAPLEVSDEDINYFVRIDNPDDPIDHALYEFYQHTGIAGFYTDTIYKKNINKPGEEGERYDFTKLAFTYVMQGEGATGFQYLTKKSYLPALLTFMKTDVLNMLPSNKIIPSLFFIDSFYTFNTPLNKQDAHGWISIYGLNTLGVTVKDVSIMSTEEKKIYRAALLAGIAEKWLNIKNGEQLQTDFYQLTRDLTNIIIPAGAYVFIPYSLYLAADKIPAPESLGLLYHPLILFSNNSMLAIPTEAMDLRAFITAAFRYTEEEFLALYTSHPTVIQKFSLIRKLLAQVEFKLP